MITWLSPAIGCATTSTRGISSKHNVWVISKAESWEKERKSEGKRRRTKADGLWKGRSVCRGCRDGDQDRRKQLIRLTAITVITSGRGNAQNTMTHGRFSSSTDPLTDNPNPLADLDDHDDLFDDNDTASQRSIPLSSPPTSPKTEPAAFTSSPTSMSPTSSDVFVRAFELDVSPKSGPPSAYTPDKAAPSKKAQRESMLLHPLTGPLILGIALVDFNHIVGPRIEFYEGEIFEDEEIAKILPFLALPDGAHLVINPVITNSWRS